MTKLIAAAALAVLAFGGEAAGGELKPMHASSIDLGTMTGIAYFTVEPEGYHVVATLIGNDSSDPVRFEAVLVSGQTVKLSTPREVGMPPVMVEISCVADQVVIQEPAAIN
ncbi:hypothetical protein RB623_01435 [Mesorhizobium sp. LHD-90]|uniref:hypothetical protein n=1 Tax=Mesorhizobium sp. LHD-90 TaxID=3071414 RepID=UPI0027E111AD|nr:hypothetical protein [Mesorhizobium sp. LHD-90]MDQ6432713.1 hypothetical protein [Mesorhizobium sp. LHD-90]